MADYERMVQDLMQVFGSAAPLSDLRYDQPYTSRDPGTKYRSGELTSDVGLLDPVDMLAGMLASKGVTLARRGGSAVANRYYRNDPARLAPGDRGRLPAMDRIIESLQGTQGRLAASAADDALFQTQMDEELRQLGAPLANDPEAFLRWFIDQTRRSVPEPRDIPLGTHGPPFDPSDPETSLRWFADQMRRMTEEGRHGWSRGTTDITPQYLDKTPLPSRPPPWPGQEAANLSGSEQSLDALLHSLSRTRQGTSASDMPDDLMEEIGMDLIQEFLKHYRRQ